MSMKLWVIESPKGEGGVRGKERSKHQLRLHMSYLVRDGKFIFG